MKLTGHSSTESNAVYRDRELAVIRGCWTNCRGSIPRGGIMEKEATVRDLTPEEIQAMFDKSREVEALVREHYSEYFRPPPSKKTLKGKPHEAEKNAKLQNWP